MQHSINSVLEKKKCRLNVAAKNASRFSIRICTCVFEYKFVNAVVFELYADSSFDPSLNRVQIQRRILCIDRSQYYISATSQLIVPNSDFISMQSRKERIFRTKRCIFSVS